LLRSMAKRFLKFASHERTNDIFQAVKSGQKTIETRPRNKKSSKDYSNIKRGDILVMRSNETGVELEKP
jgi:ASC-1-like (ASCH) protein